MRVFKSCAVLLGLNMFSCALMTYLKKFFCLYG